MKYLRCTTDVSVALCVEVIQNFSHLKDDLF